LIFNELIILSDIKELSVTEEIDKIIKEKILNKKCCTEDWQIHYTLERIKNAIIKHIKN